MTSIISPEMSLDGCGVSHAQQHALVVVSGGEIVEMDSHDNLMAKKGFYYALYMSQFKGAAPGGMEAVAMDFVST